MLKGALHVHSKYSDGEFTLSEVRAIFVGAGCSFVCVSDHSEYFNPARLSAYVAECSALSDATFRMIPGLEFSCRERMHVLGYGLTALTSKDDPQDVIRHIGEQGGVSVIAHPRDDSFAWIESFSTLPDGIETWNTKYDGRYAPRPDTFSLLQRLRNRKPEMRAFYGQDLHWKKQYRGLFTLIKATALDDPERVLEAFLRGEYWGGKDEFKLPSDGNLPQGVLQEFRRRYQWSVVFRRWAKTVKTAGDQIVLSIPGPLKARLRRLF